MKLARIAKPRRRLLGVALLPLLLAACASAPDKPVGKPAGQPAGKVASKPPAARPAVAPSHIEVSAAGREIVMYALGLIDVGYVFGGKNPEAGLDCSGMVSFIFRNAVGMEVRGSAAEIARKGRPIKREELQAGDLVFFNTMNRSFSHVGIYIGDDKFIHAPSTKGRVRIESMKTKYFATRYEAARSLLAG
ncbi:C40 family peptidase [Chitinimonas sp. JJ19]|uniref:C40 family peptidase n=1 Tax=Chitinimonas sp. JJ19 TaxID=3109352 RepID=UPI002FFE6248